MVILGCQSERNHFSSLKCNILFLYSFKPNFWSLKVNQDTYFLIRIASNLSHPSNSLIMPVFGGVLHVEAEDICSSFKKTTNIVRQVTGWTNSSHNFSTTLISNN